MKVNLLRTSWIAAVLLVPIAFTASRAGEPARWMAKITLPDGATRTVALEGVGCSAAICSRIAIKAKGEHDSIVRRPFDAIAAIKDTTEHDALFVLKDGTQRRMSLLTDFRVVYLGDGSRAEKLDLAKVRSIEFLAAPR
jgi:hypothetical protein